MSTTDKTPLWWDVGGGNVYISLIFMMDSIRDEFKKKRKKREKNQL